MRTLLAALLATSCALRLEDEADDYRGRAADDYRKRLQLHLPSYVQRRGSVGWQAELDAAIDSGDASTVVGSAGSEELVAVGPGSSSLTVPNGAGGEAGGGGEVARSDRNIFDGP